MTRWPSNRALAHVVVLSAACLAGAVLFHAGRWSPIAPDWPGDPDRTEAEEHEPGFDSPDQALAWRQIFERDEHGVIDPNGLVNARKQLDAMRAAQAEAPGGEPSSFAGLVSGDWTWLGPGNVGGRTRALAVHPTTPTSLFAGGVAGGIWKTVNSGANWTVVDDFMANLAVSSIVFRPGAPSTLLAGTGEGFYNDDAIRGAGVFISTDGGTTWTQRPSTATASFDYVNRLAFSWDGNTLLAATGAGVFRSQDLGTSWTQTLARPGMLDVKFIPGSNLRAVASGQNRWAYYSADGGATWTESGGWAKDYGGRVELGVSASSPGVVYVSMDAFASGLPAAEVWRSTDFGASYQHRVTQNLLSYQGFYDNVVWVDPTNANTLIVGGVLLYRSTDGGATFSQISGGAFHPDHHVIVHDPGFNGTSNRRAYFGNDGGVYRVDDVYAAPVGGDIPFTRLNNNYGVTQFYAGAAATDGRVLGGAQDNGTQLYTNAGGAQAWDGVNGGDGGVPAFDPLDASASYTSSQFLDLYRTNLPETYYAVPITGCGKGAPYELSDRCTYSTNFIAPMLVDQTGRMLAGGTSLWKTDNPRAAITASTGPVWASIKGPLADPYGGRISAIAVAPGAANVVWVGHNNGDVYMTTTGTAPAPAWTRVDTSAPGLPDRAVASIAIDPFDASTAYVSFGGYSPDNLWKTVNGGATWTDATGSGTSGLPSAPTRWVTAHPSVAGYVYAATDVGVFASEDGGATWQLPHGGPANVAVFHLFWRNTTLVAVTHGRGMFQAPTIGPPDAVNDSYAATAGAQLVVAAPGVLANDHRNGGTGVTAELFSMPSHGTMSPSSNGGFTYTPTAGFVGIDTFTYRARNNYGADSTATVSLTVSAAPPPTAVNDFYNTPFQTPLVIALPGVLANDDSHGSGAMTAQLVTTVSSGTLSLNSNGGFTYTPNAGFTGGDAFTYRASNANGPGNTATVSISVTAAPAPTAVNDSYSTPFQTPLTVGAPGVLANDNSNGGGAMTAEVVASPQHGTLTLGSNGGFSYTPAGGYSGGDSFTYRATNAGGDSNAASVSLTVHSAAPVPTAVSDSYSTPVSAPLVVAAPGVLANDTSNGGGAMTAAVVSSATHGTLSLGSNGGFTYTPNAGFTGGDAFTYRASNANGPGSTATVSLTIATITTAQPPTGLVASSVVGNLVTLRWTPPATGPAPTGYVLEGGVNPGGVLASFPTGSAYPVYSFAAPTGSFFVRIHTLAGGGRSGASNEIPIHVNVPVPPSAPGDLVGLVAGSTLGLAWRNTYGGGAPTSMVLDVTGAFNGSLPLGVTGSFSFPGVPQGTYTFSVRAANGGGTGVPSNAVTLTFPAPCSLASMPQPPSGFLAYAIGRTIFVVWDPAASGPAPTEYELNVTGSVVGSFRTAGRALSGAVGPGTYGLSVAAANVCGGSQWTAVQTLNIP